MQSTSDRDDSLIRAKSLLVLPQSEWNFIVVVAAAASVAVAVAVE